MRVLHIIVPKCFSDFTNSVAEIINNREIKKLRQGRYIFTWGLK